MSIADRSLPRRPSSRWWIQSLAHDHRSIVVVRMISVDRCGRHSCSWNIGVNESIRPWSLGLLCYRDTNWPSPRHSHGMLYTVHFIPRNNRLVSVFVDELIDLSSGTNLFSFFSAFLSKVSNLLDWPFFQFFFSTLSKFLDTLKNVDFDFIESYFFKLYFKNITLSIDRIKIKSLKNIFRNF